MKKVAAITLGIASVVLLSNFSAQDSVSGGREKPAINFHGVLTDTQGNSTPVENITISGSYKQIPVYQKPDNVDINPGINTTRIDLAEIEAIELDGDPKDAVSTFNKREYINIVVVSKDSKKTRKKYIIEKAKRVYCDEVNGAGPIERDLSFLAINKLAITGMKFTEEEQAKKKESSSTTHHTPPAPPATPKV